MNINEALASYIKDSLFTIVLKKYNLLTILSPYLFLSLSLTHTHTHTHMHTHTQNE